jgi:hypothetical protein
MTFRRGQAVTYTRQRDPTIFVRKDGTSLSRPLTDAYAAVFVEKVGEKSAAITINGREVKVLLRQLTAASETNA